METDQRERELRYGSGEGEVTVTPLDNGFPKPTLSEGDQRGGERGVSITLLGNVAIIKEERETYRDENSWC